MKHPDYIEYTNSLPSEDYFLLTWVNCIITSFEALLIQGVVLHWDIMLESVNNDINDLEPGMLMWSVDKAKTLHHHSYCRVRKFLELKGKCHVFSHKGASY